MESIDERLDRIEREAEDMPQLDRLNDHSLRLLIAQHLNDLGQIGKDVANKPFDEITQLTQARCGALGTLLRECEIRARLKS